MDLIEKYRPRRLDDLRQEEVERKGRQLLKAEGPKVALLEGPTGSGKTATAKIIALMTLCTRPALDGSACLMCSACQRVESENAHDFKVISAAENGGVDTTSYLAKLMRQGYAPQVLLIDEAHRLTREGHDALLVAVEKASPNCIVLLATDRPKALPERLLHRLARITFRQPSDHELHLLLQRVCRAESIEVTPADEALLLRASDRSYRGLLRQIEGARVDHRLVTDHLRRVEIERAFDYLERALLGASIAGQMIVLETWDCGPNLKVRAIDELHTRLVALSLNGAAAVFPYPELNPLAVRVVTNRLGSLHKGQAAQVHDFLRAWPVGPAFGDRDLQGAAVAYDRLLRRMEGEPARRVNIRAAHGGAADSRRHISHRDALSLWQRALSQSQVDGKALNALATIAAPVGQLAEVRAVASDLRHELGQKLKRSGFREFRYIITFGADNQVCESRIGLCVDDDQLEKVDQWIGHHFGPAQRRKGRSATDLNWVSWGETSDVQRGARQAHIMRQLLVDLDPSVMARPAGAPPLPLHEALSIRLRPHARAILGRRWSASVGQSSELAGPWSPFVKGEWEALDSGHELRLFRWKQKGSHNGC